MDTLGSVQVFSWAMAEELAVAHLEMIGFAGVRRTRSTRDGGLDAVGPDVVAQVKNLARPVGSPEIQQFRGASYGVENAVFYSRSGYSAAALEYAAASDVALFAFTDSNTVEAVNGLAKQLVARSRPTREFSELIAIAARTASNIQVLRSVITSVADAMDDAEGRQPRDPVAYRSAARAMLPLTRTMRTALSEIQRLSRESLGILVPLAQSGTPQIEVDIDAYVRVNVLIESLLRVSERARDDFAEQLDIHAPALGLPPESWEALRNR